MNLRAGEEGAGRGEGERSPPIAKDDQPGTNVSNVQRVGSTVAAESPT